MERRKNNFLKYKVTSMIRLDYVILSFSLLSISIVAMDKESLTLQHRLQIGRMLESISPDPRQDLKRWAQNNALELELWHYNNQQQLEREHLRNIKELEVQQQINIEQLRIAAKLRS